MKQQNARTLAEKNDASAYLEADVLTTERNPEAGRQAMRSQILEETIEIRLLGAPATQPSRFGNRLCFADLRTTERYG
jgi:hypothetical protein